MRQKEQRFLFNKQSPHVIEVGKPLYTAIRGQWGATYFQNEHPIVVELACGKGEYTIGLAQEFPEKNFIGVDIKGDRIARGATLAAQRNLRNVAFLRTDIRFLHEFFAPGEISELWITFPDPHPRPKWEKNRLTSPDFLALYAQLLAPGRSDVPATLHLKTDSTLLAEYSLQTLKESAFDVVKYTDDLYNSDLNQIHHGIKTTYEALFTAQGFTVHYVQAIKKAV